MTGEVIKQFLVGLGFGVDEGSMKKFSKAIDNAYVRVGLLAGAIKASAAATFMGIAKISEGFEQIGYEHRIIAPAINKAIILRKAMTAAYKDAGINMVQAVQQSVKFNLSLAKTKFQLEGIVKSTAMKFVPMLTKQMDVFRTKVSAYMPKILKFLERFVGFIFKASEAVTKLGIRVWSMLGRVWDLFYKLDDITGGWSSKLLLAVAAWKLLNLSFLMTPIGMVLTGMLALLALYDDFITYKEGGESLFDWGSDAVKTVVGLTTAVFGLFAAFKAIGVAMKVYRGIMILVNAVQAAFGIILAANPIGLIITAIAALIGLLTVLYFKWDVIKKSFSDFFSGIGGKALSFLSGLVGGGGAEIGTTVNNTAPLGSNVANNSSQNVKQETNIIVQGSSNPEATARAVTGEQNKVNFNMTRNMKGAAR
jgi:hypothetical protein